MVKIDECVWNDRNTMGFFYLFIFFFAREFHIPLYSLWDMSLKSNTPAAVTSERQKNSFL